MEQALASLPGATAVYKYGSVKALGISDIDRIAVIDGAGSLPDVWSRLSQPTRDLAMHTPVLVDVATLEHHRSFADTGTLEHVWGETLEIRQRPAPEYSEPLLAAEGLVVMALRRAKAAVTRRIKVRAFLCELGNVHIDLRLARLGRGKAPRAWQLAEEVRRVRDAWWTLDESQQRSCVLDLFADAPSALSEALEAIDADGREVLAHPQPLRLGATWGNITLLPGKTSVPTAPDKKLVIHSRRLGEARWRWISRQVRMPAGVIALLAGPPPPEYHDFRRDRDELVRNYQEFLAAHPGYSAIGLGSLFLQPRTDRV